MSARRLPSTTLPLPWRAPARAAWRLVDVVTVVRAGIAMPRTLPAPLAMLSPLDVVDITTQLAGAIPWLIARLAPSSAAGDER